VDCAHEYEVDNVDPFVLKDAPECEEDWGEWISVLFTQ
jgi:lysine biosynthesis protein LysW